LPARRHTTSSQGGTLPHDSREDCDSEALALTSFCHANQIPPLRWLTLYVNDREHAEELCQETLEAVVRNWRRVRHMDRPEAWLYRVAANRARSRWRRAGAHRRAMSRAPRVSPTAADPDEAIMVRDALARLPERQRCALTLRYLLDLPPNDVAAYMGCGVETVKTHLKRGLAHLRKQQVIDIENAESSSPSSLESKPQSRTSLLVLTSTTSSPPSADEESSSERSSAPSPSSWRLPDSRRGPSVIATRESSSRPNPVQRVRTIAALRSVTSST
jgi:RNA polymerase sigma factor (sigma-70 family)